MSDAVWEEARETPVAADCDVCVIGGSCTGVFAAVAAARLGAKVAIIERNGFFGGAATAGLVNHWHSLYDLAGERQIIAGLTQEVVDRLLRRGAVVVNQAAKPAPGGYLVLNTEQLKLELDALVREAEVQPFLYALCVAALKDGDGVRAAVIEDKTGRRAIKARCFIDASGDGDLIARARLPFRTPDDPQPPTMCAWFVGLDALDLANPDFRLETDLFDLLTAEELPRGFLWHSQVPGIPGLRMLAGTRVSGADCADADQLTRAEMEGRRQLGAIGDLLKRLPGGGETALVRLADQLGVRETRHVECGHQLTGEELLGGQRFPDAIANGTYCVDIHHSNRPGTTFRFLDGRERYVVPGEPAVESRWRPETGPLPALWQIPYRSLVVRNAGNVLVAGRLVDADRTAYGAIRVMVSCNQTGQAAAIAAFLALKAGTSVADVDPASLRDELRRQGAIVI